MGLGFWISDFGFWIGLVFVFFLRRPQTGLFGFWILDCPTSFGSCVRYFHVTPARVGGLHSLPFIPFHAFPTTRFMTETQQQPAFHNLQTKTFLLPCPPNHLLPGPLQLYLQLRRLEAKQVLGARCVCQLPACLRKLWSLGLRYCTRGSGVC